MNGFSEKFEGWYFKHQKGKETLALIPGRAKSGAFVQVITNRRSLHFDVPGLQVDDTIQAGGCIFGTDGVVLDLPGVKGRLSYGPFSRLSGDIMGPFRFFPMECRHGVISMRHRVRGSVEVEGETLDFDGGTGYIEKDSGTSFPSEYLWLQCNDFSFPCSIMAAVARIPFAGLHFTGCICSVLYGGKEYRLATYRGARVTAAGPKKLCIEQGPYRLEVSVTDRGNGHSLYSPVRGAMSGQIKECNNASGRFRLFLRDTALFDLSSENVSFECELHPANSAIRRS